MGFVKTDPEGAGPGRPVPDRRGFSLSSAPCCPHSREALRLPLDEEQSLDALDREAVMTLTREDIVGAALALGEEPDPEPLPEPEPSRWWRWLG